jgi:lipoic acid synthetase
MLKAKPAWLKVRPASGENYFRLKSLLKDLNLATVCQEAKCPNIGECWNGGTATVMLMGEVCTRGCRFCAVKTGNPKKKLDLEEPQKVGFAISQMDLNYVVLTSVDRDDLPDQGAAHFAKTISVIKENNSKILIEVLAPDFCGRRDLVQVLVHSEPDVFAHNVETVERLTPKVRDPRAAYKQSLEVLKMAKELNPKIKTKTSLMLGLGESAEEVEATLKDLREVGCDVVTFGQYLQPTARHLKVERFITPEEFSGWQTVAEELGFLYVASGPLVRSSYRAGEFFMKALIQKERPQEQLSNSHKIESRLKVQNWGLLSYKQALVAQEELVDQVSAQKISSTLIFCSHPPVVTMGRRADPLEVTGWDGELVTTNRGGRTTYHGPSQIVVYPILDLKIYGRDVHRYLRCLESALVECLKEFGVEARGRSQEKLDLTGVWVGSKKIASLGIAIRNWVSFHGLALNVYHDEKAFKGIQPCGLTAEVMTSLEEVCGKKMDSTLVAASLEKNLKSQLELLTQRQSLEQAQTVETGPV